MLTGPIGRWRAVRWARGLPGGLGLVLLCAAVYLPGLFQIPPVDRDEARFAQASRQMFESAALPADQQNPAFHDGGWVVPKVQDRPRLNKPPLIYWVQAASAWILAGGNPLHDSIWMYRLPSAICAMIAVFATWRVGVGMFDPRAGWVGAALLAVCPMIVWDAHQARADELLLACTTVTMWAFWHLWRGKAGWRWPVVFWVGVALGILAKGPITPMVAGLTLLAVALLTRRWKWLARTKPLVGLGIVAVLVLPWVIAVIHKVGFSTYWDTIFGETVGRSGSAREGHAGPPGYHLLFLVVLFWPGVLMTALSFTRAVRRAWGVALPTGDEDDDTETETEAHDGEAVDNESPGEEKPKKPPILARIRAVFTLLLGRLRGRPGELFCLAWIVPSWIVFELVATKLPHYTLPLYPAVALLTARGLLAAADGMMPGLASGSVRLGHWAWLFIGVFIVAGVPIGVSVFGPIPVILAGILIAGVSAELLRRSWRRLSMGQVGGAQAWSVAAVVVAQAGLLGVVLPYAKGLWLSPQLAEIAEHAGKDLPIASVGYHEDSLVFLTRGRLEKIDEARDWLRDHHQGILIAPPEDTMGENPRLPGLEKIGNVRGVNYSTGKITDLGVYEVGP